MITIKEAKTDLRPVIAELIGDGETDPKSIIDEACYLLGYEHKSWMDRLVSEALGKPSLCTVSTRRR